MKRIVVFCVLVLVCVAGQQQQHGQIVRPRNSGHVSIPTEIRTCPQDEWDMINAISRYSNWTVDTIPQVGGFTILISQWKVTVSAQCFATTIDKYLNGTIVFTNLYPTKGEQIRSYNLQSDGEGGVTEASTNASPKIMIAGASSNFLAYAVCNEQSGHINLQITYSRHITEDEKRAINQWIKASNLPMIGRWGAVNFDSCSLTKTYVCNGGKDVYCATVKKQSKKNQSFDEEDEEDDYFMMW